MFWKDRKKFRKKISAAFPACYRKDVAEILEALYNGLRERNNEDYRAFCRLNYTTFHKGYDRMLSYWAEYYRWYDPRTQKYCKTRYRDYVGWKLYAEVFGCKK